MPVAFHRDVFRSTAVPTKRRWIPSKTAPTNIIPINDVDVFFSPYNWYKSGSTYAQTTNPGAYIKIAFTGTSIEPIVDVSPLTAASTTAADYPRFLYSVDGGAWTSRLLTSSDSTLTLAGCTGLADTSHTFELVFVACGWTSEDRWTVPSMALRITGFQLDIGKDVTPPTTYSGRMIVYGDSHGEGHEALAATVNVTNQDASQAFPYILGRGCECEVGVVAFAGQGYATVVGSGHNLVDLEASYGSYYAGQSRLSAGLFSPAPDYIIINEGTNDSGTADGTVTTSVTNTINALRAAAPSAPIFICIPPALIKETAIRSGVTGAGDGNTFVIDHNTSFDSGRYYNGSHMSVRAHALYAAIVANQMADALGGGGSGVLLMHDAGFGYTGIGVH